MPYVLALVGWLLFHFNYIPLWLCVTLFLPLILVWIFLLVGLFFTTLGLIGQIIVTLLER